MHGLEGRGEDRSLKLLSRLELRGDGGLDIGKGGDYLTRWFDSTHDWRWLPLCVLGIYSLIIVIKWLRDQRNEGVLCRHLCLLSMRDVVLTAQL